MKLILKRFDIIIKYNTELDYPKVRSSFIHDISNDKIIGWFEIDERHYNSIKTAGNEEKAHIFISYVERKFNEFKRSSYLYGNYIEDSDTHHNMGSIPLMVKDFIEFLRIEERDLTIDKILQK